MTWQRRPLPADGLWREVHPEHVAGLDQVLWLHCAGCGHELYVDPLNFAREHGLSVRTPLLTIGNRLRCSRCGERKGGCRPMPPPRERPPAPPDPI